MACAFFTPSICDLHFIFLVVEQAEKLPVELDISTCYDLVEQFCVHISSHLIVMDKQRYINRLTSCLVAWIR